MQTSYSLDLAAVGYPGQIADSGPMDIVSGIAYRQGALLAVITAANSTVYTLTATPADGSPAVTATMTSDASGTIAEIAVGLAASAAGKQAFPYDLTPVATGLILQPKPGALVPYAAVTNTGAGTIVISAASGNVRFGTFVCFDGAALKVRAPAAAGDVGFNTVGLVLSTQFTESEYRPANPSNLPFVAAGEMLNIMRAGRAWAVVEQAVTVGTQVFVRHTTSGLLLPGGVRADVDTANAVALPGAKFLDNASAGGYARVQLNIA